MAESSRDKILRKLKEAGKRDVSSRPSMPPLNELSWDTEKLIDEFTSNIVEQTGVVDRVADTGAARVRLGEILREEEISKVMASTDDVVTTLDLASWGSENNIEVMTAEDFEDRDSFKQAVFCEVGAGITGADYGIAESGTLVIAHGKDQPRLVSLAPITHIVIMPLDRLRPVYEDATDRLFADGGSAAPGQVSFITGPSMTGDIQGIPFKGMHGPKKIFVILIENAAG
jgi:L-lactate dehydrogenase complex protein LldG